MSINKKIEINWKGEAHSLLITMRHVDEIEADFNLIKFAHELNMADCRYSKVAWLVAKFLNMCGSEVTQDDVWNEMFGAGEVSPVDALEIGKAIVSACMPAIPEEASKSKKKSVKKKSKK